MIRDASVIRNELQEGMLPTNQNPGQRCVSMLYAAISLNDHYHFSTVI